MKMLCPHCGVKGTADDSYTGKMVRCPRCDTEFKVAPEENKSVALPPTEPEIQDLSKSQDGTTLLYAPFEKISRRALEVAAQQLAPLHEITALRQVEDPQPLAARKRNAFLAPLR